MWTWSPQLPFGRLKQLFLTNMQEQWTSNPFVALEREDGYIQARGTQGTRRILSLQLTGLFQT